MTLSACVEMLFRDLPVSERLEQVRTAGLRAFEFWNFRNHDLALIAERKEALGLTVAAFVGNPGAGLVDPADRGQLVDTFGQACEAARQLDCHRLIVTTGAEREGVPRAAQHESIAAGLSAIAPLAADADVVIALEPLNIKVDHAGYYLWSAEEGFDLVDEVNHPQVRVLFDVYHEQVQTGNVTARMLANLDRIGYLHLADVPGRMEPGTGELNYPVILSKLAQAGYDGFVGLEFRPSTSDHAAIVRGVVEQLGSR